MTEDTRSPEQKEADRKRMEKVRAARGGTQVKTPASEKKEEKVEVPKATLDKLLAEVEELKKEPKSSPEEVLASLVRMSGAGVNKQGVQGAVDLASTNIKDYEDPRERLYEEFDKSERTSRLGLRKNYSLKWSVEADVFKKDGVSYRFPRFRCELWQLLFNDDGTPLTRVNKNGKTVRKEAFLRRSLQKAEDEVDAQIAIKKMGFEAEVDETNLLNELRYLRLRDWLLEKFFPPTVEYEDTEEERVIGGVVLPVREFEESASVLGK